MQLGDMAGAELLFNRLLEKKPRSSETLATLAQIAINRGDTSKAEMFLRKAISYYPEDSDLRQNLDAVLRLKKR